MNLRNRFKIMLYQTLTLISPKLNSKVVFKNTFKSKLNLKAPLTFNEKLMYLKLYDYPNNELVIKCSDKLLVRDYVKQKGYENILNSVLEVYDSASSIDWESLPDQFALKWNFGAGYNIICDDKSKIIKQETISK